MINLNRNKIITHKKTISTISLFLSLLVIRILNHNEGELIKLFIQKLKKTFSNEEKAGTFFWGAYKTPLGFKSKYRIVQLYSGHYAANIQLLTDSIPELKSPNIFIRQRVHDKLKYKFPHNYKDIIQSIDVDKIVNETIDNMEYLNYKNDSLKVWDDFKLSITLNLPLVDILLFQNVLNSKNYIYNVGYECLDSNMAALERIILKSSKIHIDNSQNSLLSLSYIESSIDSLICISKIPKSEINLGKDLDLVRKYKLADSIDINLNGLYGKIHGRFRNNYASIGGYLYTTNEWTGFIAENIYKFESFSSQLPSNYSLHFLNSNTINNKEEMLYTIAYYIAESSTYYYYTYVPSLLTYKILDLAMTCI